MFWQYVEEVVVVGVGDGASASVSKPAWFKNLPKQANPSALTMPVSYRTIPTLKSDEQDVNTVSEVVVVGETSFVYRRHLDSRARSVMRIPGTVSRLVVPILRHDQQNTYDM